jgi:hypothetical protein
MQKLTLVTLLAGLVASGACASAQAKAPADRPTLDVPAPPIRMIEPTPRPEPLLPEPVPDLPPANAPNPRPRPTPPRDPAKTDPKPEAPAAEVAPPVAPVTPPPQLRTSSTADAAEAEKQVRTVMESANKTLNSIDWRRLSKSQQEQYDTAKRMITESDEKLKESKVEIARNLATKAERIAKELLGR